MLIHELFWDQRVWTLNWKKRICNDSWLNSIIQRFPFLLHWHFPCCMCISLCAFVWVHLHAFVYQRSCGIEITQMWLGSGSGFWSTTRPACQSSNYLNYFWRNNAPKHPKSDIIYSNSCRSKLVWLDFTCRTQLTWILNISTKLNVSKNIIDFLHITTKYHEVGGLCHHTQCQYRFTW